MKNNIFNISSFQSCGQTDILNESVELNTNNEEGYIE